MQNSKDKEISVTKKIRKSQFNSMIRLNQQHETFHLFAMIIEILRFLLGHSLVYCLFMTENFDNTANGALFITLRNLFLINLSSNYQWPQIFSLTLLFIMLLSITISSLNDKINQRFNSEKLLYYTKNLIKIGTQLSFGIFAIVFYTTITTENYFFFLLVLFEIILILLVFKVSAIFEQKNKFQTDDLYAYNQNFTAEAINLLFCILCLIGPYFVLLGVPQFMRAIIMLIWISLQLVRMKSTVIFPYYKHQMVQKMYITVVSIQTSQIFVQSLADFIKLDMIANNAPVVIAILSIFLVWGLLNFVQSLVEKSYFLNIEDIQSKRELYLLMNSYYSALQSLQKSNDLTEVCLIVSSIRRNHQNTCKHSECYCHKQNDLKNFLKSYLYEILLKLENLYSHNQAIMLYIYSFKFHVYHYYAKIYQQIDILEKMKEMSSYEFFLSMKLKHKLRKWIQAKNKQNKVIRVCRAIRLEEDLVLIDYIIVDDIETKFKKWSNLSKELSRIEEFRNMSNKEIQNLIKMEAIKTQKWQFYNRSPTFNAVFYFYFKKIVLKDSDLVNLQENIRDLSRKMKEEEYSKATLFSKYLFSQNSCTVECSMKEANLGMIINTSKSVQEVFGYNKRKIIGENVSCFFPPFLAKQHAFLLKEWAESGSKIEDLSSIGEITCEHKDHYCFMAQRCMNLYAGLNQITLNGAFLRKNQSDMVLINSKNQLQCYGGSLKTILKHVKNKIECDNIFKDMKNKLINADFNEEKLQTTIIFNESITNRMLNGSRNTFQKQKIQIK